MLTVNPTHRVFFPSTAHERGAVSEAGAVLAGDDDCVVPPDERSADLRDGADRPEVDRRAPGVARHVPGRVPPRFQDILDRLPLAPRADVHPSPRVLLEAE